MRGWVWTRGAGVAMFAVRAACPLKILAKKILPKTSLPQKSLVRLVDKDGLTWEEGGGYKRGPFGHHPVGVVPGWVC